MLLVAAAVAAGRAGVWSSSSAASGRWPGCASATPRDSERRKPTATRPRRTGHNRLSRVRAAPRPAKAVMRGVYCWATVQNPPSKIHTVTRAYLAAWALGGSLQPVSVVRLDSGLRGYRDEKPKHPSGVGWV